MIYWSVIPYILRHTSVFKTGGNKRYFAFNSLSFIKTLTVIHRETKVNNPK